MDILQIELDDIKSNCENVVEGSKIIACVPAQVRIELK